ncbi:MAG: hypothetical protein Kow0027_12000 [Saprospiraceae bacterium]
MTFAQQAYYTARNAPPRLKKSLDKARFLAASGELSAAANELGKALEKEPRFMDGLIELGNVYNQMGDYASAELQYEKAIAIDSTYLSSLYYSLGIVEFDQDKFSEAKAHFEKFLTLEREGTNRYQNARRYLANSEFAARAVANPVPFEPKNIGSAINTAEDEYLPSLTADGEVLIFTAVRNGQEDFYRSKRADSTWMPAEPISAVNTEYNEGAQTITADGKLLIFTICNKPGGLGRCDLYFTEFKNGNWTPVRNLGRPVNSAAYESLPSLSAEGDALYFTSNRKGGFGGLDLWVSYRKPDGHWGEPVNLGSTINTPFDEQAPFIHPDGQTLYFMSKGHRGMGAYDLFLSRKDEKGNWSSPENLGYPINSRGNEGALTVSLDGKTAFYASDMPGGFGKNDIYYFELYEGARPQPVTYVKARVFDEATKKPLAALMEIFDLGSGQLVARKITGEDGEFLSTLPSGKDYALHVSKEGYLFYSDNFSLSGWTDFDSTFHIQVPLVKIPAGARDTGEVSSPVVLRNVFFESGSADLLPKSRVELDKLYDLLVQNPALKIQINGHTDNVGSEQDNLELSLNRAKAVYDYLVEKGIDPGRLRYKGFGETKPVSSNDTEEGRSQNRRTEFQIIH